ncbi:MAG: hypothetical protein NVS4B7_05030 [Ktedonobacteraceae bacterium]
MLSYQLKGSGNPLLLIHGWGVTYTIWRELIPLLVPHFQLILVELPGMDIAQDLVPEKPYYLACAEALEELRIDLHIETWAILAYSTGTRACEAYMQQYPQRVSQAVFLCPAYIRKSWQAAIQIEQWIDSKYARVANWFLSGWLLYGMLLGFGFNLHCHDHVHECMKEITMRPQRTLKRTLFELPGKGRAPFTLPTSPPVPTLFIWGRQDALIARPPRLRPNDIVIFANHSAPLLTPHSVVSLALSFLKKEVYGKESIVKGQKNPSYDMLIQQPVKSLQQ